jgi:hypothetical protein
MIEPAQELFGPLDWVEECSLKSGPVAFADLLAGRAASPEILFRPNQP